MQLPLEKWAASPAEKFGRQPSARPAEKTEKREEGQGKIQRHPKLAGQTFGRLLVMSEHGINNSGKRTWLCQCSCGRKTIVPTGSLRSGNTSSCGCLIVETTIKRSTVHGHSRSRKRSGAYASWAWMKSRCLNPADTRWIYYGGRGVTICERWMKFENFFADMGDRPHGMTLERKNNLLGYAKSNCVWASPTEQANNRRGNHIIEFLGKKQTMAQWSRELGISSRKLKDRLGKLRWTIQRALTTP